jgi:hypothetical protein
VEEAAAESTEAEAEAEGLTQEGEGEEQACARPLLDWFLFALVGEGARTPAECFLVVVHASALCRSSLVSPLAASIDAAAHHIHIHPLERQSLAVV